MNEANNQKRSKTWIPQFRLNAAVTTPILKGGECSKKLIHRTHSKDFASESWSISSTVTTYSQVIHFQTNICDDIMHLLRRRYRCIFENSFTWYGQICHGLANVHRLKMICVATFHIDIILFEVGLIASVCRIMRGLLSKHFSAFSQTNERPTESQ